MSQKFHFEALTGLIQTTHEEMQGRAVRSVNVALVVRNWLIGWYIAEYEQLGEDRAKYGDRLFDRLASAVRIRGTSPTNLRKFRQFYRDYPIQQTLSVESDETPLLTLLTLQTSPAPQGGTWQQLSQELAGEFVLSWSHYVTLLTIDNSQERRFYEIEAAENSWSVRELERQIASSLYERLALSRNKEEIRKLSEQGLVIEKAADLIKNPLVLEFLELEGKAVYSEDELESAIISKLEHFLLELGKGFLFESRQKRFTFDNDHFYIDLVFYNRLLRCYVLIDLKRDKLTHQDLGQMQMYVNYFDRYVKTDDETPTIGIVLCHRKNDALVELTLPQEKNIYASKYLLYLPSKEELRTELMKIEAALEVGGK